ncbi:hypothetical protein B4102_1135 [Heyndrickxia sporothermodurans]|uniref:Uncharacterized protein n=1 Tax=Heyndrickxia sporothermodurans TaxID=46224 RepID=A0A150KNL1_9BACI|nr:hypothetical protein B4102_1135 [Heyndrickxia sporothermodurans]
MNICSNRKENRRFFSGLFFYTRNGGKSVITELENSKE